VINLPGRYWDQDAVLDDKYRKIKRTCVEMTMRTEKRLGSGWLRFICLGFLLLLLAGCEAGQQEKQGQKQQIRLDRLKQLPVEQIEPDSQTLRVGVGAVLSPQGTALSYQPLINYLSRRMNKPAVLVQRRTYQELNDLLARNVVDIGIICTGAYRKETMSLLVVPQINGKTIYQSFIIVPASSPIREFPGLRGKVFAFTDPLSNTGYLAPIALLRSMGQQPETFFARTIFTHGHDRSVAAVMEGIADGASVDNLVYEFIGKRNEEIGRKTKVIWKSAEFGIPPVVVPRTLSPAIKSQLKELLLGLHQDPEGIKALEVIGVERFVEPEPSMYGL